MLTAEDTFHGWPDSTPHQDGVDEFLTKTDNTGAEIKETPKVRKKKKKKKKKKSKRQPKDIPTLAMEQLISQRENRLRQLELEEQERNLERKREREKERVLREIRVNTKCKNTLKVLQRKLDTQRLQSELSAMEHLRNRRLKFNEHSSKNPDWIPNLRSHADNYEREQKIRSIEHSRKLRELLRENQDTAPVFSYSKTLEIVRREEAEKLATENAKKEEPALNHMRKKKYGKFVSEMFTPKPPTKGPIHSPRSLDFEHVKTPTVGRSELLRIGNDNMRSSCVKPVLSASHSRRNRHKETRQQPVPNCRQQGMENMRYAARLIRPADPHPPPKPPSRGELCRQLISISKRHVGNPGWDDQKLRLLSDGRFYKDTAASLLSLHTSTDAMVEAVNTKVALLRKLQSS
eukprot:TRINITY_DN8460_c0_g1_i1.p1 TRINITY_DN8460_c0_g1~~TRINITY_DN8460_c0_g1_i1.p1  ORF type:complete len:404 (+),score=75.88 TRINITY_DN8460_c0_g1_i1:68-1279(+)